MSNSGAKQQTTADANVEQNVPIRLDSRTFEQREQDIVSNLERTQKAAAVEGEQQKQVSNTTTKQDATSDWADEVNQWAMQTRKRWNDAIRRAHRNIFTLLPSTPFNAGPIVPFGGLGPFGHLPAIMQQMQRQLDALDDYVVEPANLLSIVDPRTGGLLALTEQSRPECPLGYLAESYVVNDRGEVTFRARFNAKGFHPDQLHVTTSKNRLTVSGKRSTRTDTSSSVSEFSRTIYLPNSVDHSHVDCYLTKDGVLTVEAPVFDVNKSALGFDSNAQLAVRPQEPNEGLALQLSGVCGVQIMPSQSGGQLVHVEVPVDAEFTADDLLVQVDANRVNVSGKKRVTEGSGDLQCDHEKQFSRSYVVPQTLDALALRSQLIGHTLVLEAPLVPTQ